MAIAGARLLSSLQLVHGSLFFRAEGVAEVAAMAVRAFLAGGDHTAEFCLVTWVSQHRPHLIHSATCHRVIVFGKTLELNRHALDAAFKLNHFLLLLNDLQASLLLRLSMRYGLSL
eukprot:jgi/Mesen1/7182/ME000037S06542